MKLTLPILFVFLFAPVLVSEESGDYIHYRLGVNYKNENKFDQALEEFRKVLTAYPDNYNAYMQIAEIKKSQNMPRLEIYNLKKALAYNPGWGKAHLMLSDAYERDMQIQNSIMEAQIYQQSCDPSEQENVQKRIDKLVRKLKGEREPAAGGVDSLPSGVKKTGMDTAAATSDGEHVASEKKSKPSSPALPAPSKIVKTTPSSPSDLKSRRLPGPQATVPFAPDGEIDKTLKRAMTLHQEGKSDEALLLIKKVLAERPRYPPAYFYGGLIRYHKGDYGKAKINFAKSFSFPDASIAAHYYLGKIFAAEKYDRGAIDELSIFVAKASDGEQKKDAMQVLADLTKRAADTASGSGAATPPAAPVQTEPAVPESAYATFELRIDSLLTMELVDTLSEPGRAMLAGVAEFLAGRFDNAVKEFKKTMSAYPAGSVGALCSYNIGVCYMKLRLFKNADNQFDNLRNRYPQHRLSAQGLFLKAFSLYERGNMALAEKGFREFIQKFRSHAWTPKAYEKLGDVYEDVKQLTKAMDAYQQAAALAADCGDRAYAFFKLGNVCMEAGNPDRAVVSYKKAIEVGEGKGCFVRAPDAYYKIADYRYRQKDLKNALEVYQKATRKYPGYQETPWGLFQTGNIYKNMRNYRKAAEVYKELLQRFPDDYWAKQARWKLDDAMWENEYQTVLH